MAWDLKALATAFESVQGPWADLAIKSSILIVAAGVLARALRRRSAATRHCVWALAFTGLLFLPLFSFFLPAWRITVATPAAESAMGSAVFFSSPGEASRPPSSQEIREGFGQLPAQQTTSLRRRTIRLPRRLRGLGIVSTASWSRQFSSGQSVSLSV